MDLFRDLSFLAIIIALLLPIIQARRKMSILATSLQLVSIPEISTQLSKKENEQNVALCFRERHMIGVYYPYLLFVVLASTITTWYLMATANDLSTAYLLINTIATAGLLVQSWTHMLPAEYYSWSLKLMAARITYNRQAAINLITTKEQERLELEQQGSSLAMVNNEISLLQYYVEDQDAQMLCIRDAQQVSTEYSKM